MVAIDSSSDTTTVPLNANLSSVKSEQTSLNSLDSPDNSLEIAASLTSLSSEDLSDLSEFWCILPQTPDVSSSSIDNSHEHKNNANAQPPSLSLQPPQPTPFLLKTLFSKQPPTNVRKLSIFSFDLALYSHNRERQIHIVQAKCLGFFNCEPTENGLHYAISYTDAQSNSNELATLSLFVRLVDSTTGIPIKYVGIDKNPDLQHALLTHDSACNRCSAAQKCKSQKETPADPILLGEGQLRLFTRANQNCVIGAGAPAKKDQRRFCLEVSTSHSSASGVVYSQPIFVHNSSKIGRLTTKQLSTTTKKIALQQPTVPGPGSQFSRLAALVHPQNESNVLNCEEIYKRAADMIEESRRAQLLAPQPPLPLTPNSSFELTHYSPTMHRPSYSSTQRFNPYGRPGVQHQQQPVFQTVDGYHHPPNLQPIFPVNQVHNELTDLLGAETTASLLEL